MAAGEPFVGPGEDASPGNPGRERGADLPGQYPPLLLLALMQRIDAELGQHQRPVDGEVVQPPDIARERPLVVQIDVEADEIGEIDGQVFGRRKVGVADQRLRVLSSDQGDEALQKAPHRLGAVPADHIGRDLVADQIGEDRRMARAGANPGDHRRADIRLGRAAVEKGDVLRPGQPDQHPQPRHLGGVEQPERRHREHPDRVDPGFAHQREIPVDDRGFGKRRAVAADPEGAVGDALDEMLALAGEKELAADPDRRGRLDRRGRHQSSGCGNLVAVDQGHP